MKPVIEKTCKQHSLNNTNKIGNKFTKRKFIIQKELDEMFKL